MKLKLEFTMDGAAFQVHDAPELEAGRILIEYGKRLQDNPTISPGWETAIRDVNGNEVGFMKFERGAR